MKQDALLGSTRYDDGSIDRPLHQRGFGCQVELGGGGGGTVASGAMGSQDGMNVLSKLKLLLAGDLGSVKLRDYHRRAREQRDQSPASGLYQCATSQSASQPAAEVRFGEKWGLYPFPEAKHLHQGLLAPNVELLSRGEISFRL